MTKRTASSLDDEVLEARREISTDGYPMSIGELTNLYRDKELTIRPEFQRFFRWTPLQKSRLVESLLLGIPLPSIFVSQQEAGKWELVDGLQRVSTILELQGELQDPDGNTLPPLMLEGTKFLPALEGKQWKDATAENLLSAALQLDIKRTKIDVKIIKRESSPQTKYDLFQRLNSYGSKLTAQELRSALLVAISPQFFKWIEDLSQHASFLRTVDLSERLKEERYDLDLVLRFLVLHNRSGKQISIASLRDLPRLLDDESASMATSFAEVKENLDSVFRSTFDYIDSNGGADVFRRWDSAKKDFVGSFLNSAFEIFALGAGYQIANKKPLAPDLLMRVKKLWKSSNMAPGYATGRSTEARLSEYIPLGRQLTAV